MPKLFNVFFVCLFILLGSSFFSQKISAQDSLLTVEQIKIFGNKKTKPYIILREMEMVPGTKVSRADLADQIKEEENKIFNLRLFLEVKIKDSITLDQKLYLNVTVKERWYFYPIPILEIQARNVSDWLRNFNGGLSRLRYGLKLTRYNARGRNERYRFNFETGFANLFQLSYNFPSINKKQNLGLFLKFGYVENNNVFWDLEESKQKFLVLEEPILRRIRGEVGLNYRQDFYTNHGFALEFKSYFVSDTLSIINENFLSLGNQQDNFFEFRYNFSHDKRDRRNYALNGYLLRFSARQIGLGLSGDYLQTELTADYSRYITIKENLYFSGRLSFNLSTPENQAFNFNRAIGYGSNLLRGFEVYAINGESFALHKFNLKHKLFSKIINLRRIVKLSQFNEAPLDIYFKLFADGGYVVRNEIGQNRPDLINQYIYSFGAGLDVVSFYDFVIRFELSQNSLNETNFAFNLKADLFH